MTEEFRKRFQRFQLKNFHWAVAKLGGPLALIKREDSILSQGSNEQKD